MKTAKGGPAKKKTTVYFIGAGPGDPELITVKGRKVLKAADIVIYAGSLVNPALLAGLKGAVYDSAPMHLDEITALMKGAADKGAFRRAPPYGRHGLLQRHIGADREAEGSRNRL